MAEKKKSLVENSHLGELQESSYSTIETEKAFEKIQSRPYIYYRNYLIFVKENAEKFSEISQKFKKFKKIENFLFFFCFKKTQKILKNLIEKKNSFKVENFDKFLNSNDYLLIKEFYVYFYCLIQNNVENDEFALSTLEIKLKESL